MNKNRLFEKYTILFLVGGLGYYNIELLWRRFSHISMFLCGGLSLVLVGAINQAVRRDVSLVTQMVLGAAIITILEFVTGLIVNVWLKLNIWDYSDMPYNIYGQVCLLYSFYWFFLSGVCIFLDDWIRVKIFGERRPHYRII